MSAYEQINLDKIKTYSINERFSKVEIDNFAKPFSSGRTIGQFINDLPDILIGKDFKNLIDQIVIAYREHKEIIVMMGAHVIKCGLNPILIQLIEKGVIKCLAINGAGIVHDSELANWGITSEDVADTLKDGSFGMVTETAAFLNNALEKGAKEKSGLGEAIGHEIERINSPYKKLSVLAAAYRNKVPVTVHVAIGTDILHQHPRTNGAIVGELSYRDFKIFCNQVSKLTEGSVVLNFGSAVVLPEVFLKAVTIVRNLGHDAHKFITANFDMIRHYRPTVNIVQRPTQTGGKGYHFTGHHEIMIPLLAAGILEKIES